MAICCETFILTEVTDTILLGVVDKIMKEHFFSSCGLLKLGWCSNERVVNYPIENGSVKKTQIFECYWLNCSPVSYDKNKSLDEVKVCNCLHCRIFSS